MLRRKLKPFKKNYRNNKTVFLPYNSPVRQFSVRIARKTYTANSRRKKKSRFVPIECVWSSTVLVSSFSAVYLQRGLKLDPGAETETLVGTLDRIFKTLRVEHRFTRNSRFIQCCLVGLTFKLRKRVINSPLCSHVLHKGSNLVISRWWFGARAERLFFLIKSIVLWCCRHRRRRRSSSFLPYRLRIPQIAHAK